MRESIPQRRSAPWPMVRANVEITLLGRPVKMGMDVPSVPVRPRELLPLFRGVAEGLMGIVVEQAQAEGRKVSCRKGCGACCRQLVPIAPCEAYAMAEVIAAMPAERRGEVERRMAEGRRRLEQAGMLGKLSGLEKLSEEQACAIGPDYFRLGIPCPFLVEESCSIYPDRPTICREYLVTSPPEACAALDAKVIQMLKLPTATAMRAVCRLEKEPDATVVPWVLLLLAPEFVATRPEPPASRTGAELIQEFFQVVTGHDVSPAP